VTMWVRLCSLIFAQETIFLLYYISIFFIVTSLCYTTFSSFLCLFFTLCRVAGRGGDCSAAAGKPQRWHRPERETSLTDAHKGAVWHSCCKQCGRPRRAGSACRSAARL
jgi:hypothetical protein